MSKKFNNVKTTFSNLHPSDECIERIFDMTVDKNKSNSGVIFKRIMATALALAIFVCGGFGVNELLKNNSNKLISSAGYSIGGVMTVSAKEELKGETNASEGYDLGYRIYAKDITGLSDKEIENEKIKMAKLYLASGDEELLLSEKVDEFTLNDTIKNNVHKNGNIIYATERGFVEQALTICGIDNPSTVKEIRVSNESDFGYPIIEADDLYYTKNPNGDYVYDNIGVDTDKTSIKGHNISLSGDRYLQCRILENPEVATYTKDSFDKNSMLFGKELATGKVFYIIYEFSDEFYNMLGNNPDYNLTDYNDKIYVTVEFKDGKKAKNIIEFSIDKYGKTYCSYNSYSLKN